MCTALFVFSSRIRHTRCALVTGVQTCALPISIVPVDVPAAPLAPAGASRPGRKVSASKAAVQRAVRGDCRRQLTAKGLNIAETQAIGRASCRERVCQYE